MITHIEYACIDEFNLKTVMNNVFEAVECGVHAVSLQNPHINSIFSFLPNNILISSPVDFPYGFGFHKDRLSSTKRVLDLGVDIVDLPVQYHLAGNLTEFIRNLNEQYELCNASGSILRIIMDYRYFEQQEYVTLLKNIRKNTNITDLICSSGLWHDDVLDNLTVSGYINKEAGFDVISNGNMYTKEHMNLIYDAGKSGSLYGIRFNKLNLMKKALAVYNNIGI